MQRLLLLTTSFILLLAACSPSLPESTPPVAPTTQSIVSDQLNVIATQTQSAALALAATDQQKASQPPAPALTPSPLPVITPVLQEAGLFRQFSHQEALILGKVLGLQAVKDGFLLFSEGGISYFEDHQWTGYFTQEMGSLIGADATGRAWVAAADGSIVLQSSVSLTDHKDLSDGMETWIIFGAEEGWMPVIGFTGSPVQFGLLTDSQGNIWTTTQQDIRMFNGIWQVYDSQAMGMSPAGEGATAEFTIFPNKLNGAINAGRCDLGGTGPAGGGGWRVFDGASWSEPDSAFNAGCVSAFAQDTFGKLWIAQDANLWFYNPGSPSLEEVPLPEPPQSYRFGYFIDLTISPDNSLWAQLALCSEADCFGGVALYRLTDGIWQQIGEPNPAAGQKIFFDKNGSAWLLSAGSIYLAEDASLQQVPELIVQAAAVDDAGTLWLLAQASGPPTLWTQR